MLERVTSTIHDAPERTKYAMNNFIYTVGVSYLPLHNKAVTIAEEVGPVEVNDKNNETKFLNASVHLQKAIDKEQLGFKRKYVRC